MFDSRNRLIQAGSTTYRYDAENQRIGVNQTQFVVNSQPALSQVLVKEENGVKTFYVYGLGLIGQETSGEYLSYHFDLRGSTVALTNSTAQVTERFQYSPYGVLISGNVEKTPFLFNGMYGVMTDSNGLYYMRARFYSPEMRRFVNQDILLGSIFEGQTLNRYAFVTGNPVKYTDPFGLENFDFSGMGYPFGEPTELGISDVITITISILDAIDTASDIAYMCSVVASGGTTLAGAPLQVGKKAAIKQLIDILSEILRKQARELKSGDLFEYRVETRKGPVDMLAEIVIDGDTLHLKDIAVYAEGKDALSGLEKEMFRSRRQLIEIAKRLGFKKLRITGTRHPNSTSANPGKQVDVNVDLCGRCK